MQTAEVEPSGRSVLKCARCGETLILLGCEEDWRSESRTTFGCGRCGEDVTFADRLCENGAESKA